jgi:hypothetical protein
MPWAGIKLKHLGCWKGNFRLTHHRKVTSLANAVTQAFSIFGMSKMMIINSAVGTTTMEFKVVASATQSGGATTRASYFQSLSKIMSKHTILYVEHWNAISKP